MSLHARAKILFVLKLCVSVSLLVFVFSRVETQPIASLISTANVGLLLVGALCLIAQTAVASLKWYILLRGQGASPAYMDLLRINLISGFINLFTPGTVAGDAYRVVRVKRYTSGVRGALPAVIVDRGTGVLALAVIGTIGMATLYSPEKLLLVAFAMSLSIPVVYAFVVGPMASFSRRLGSGALFGAAGVIDQVVQALQPSGRLLSVVLLSFVFQLNTVWISWIYSVAMGVTVDIGQLLVLVPVVYLVEMIPISISGVGVRESTLTVLFGEMGLVPEHGLVLGLTITAMRYVTGAIGGILLALDAFSPRRS